MQGIQRFQPPHPSRKVCGVVRRAHSGSDVLLRFISLCLSHTFFYALPQLHTQAAAATLDHTLYANTHLPNVEQSFHLPPPHPPHDGRLSAGIVVYFHHL